MKSRSEALLTPRARITGVIYLTYFLSAILAAVIKVHEPIIYSNIVNLVGNMFYIIVTLLFYYMFKPVNKLVSFVAALFSLVGCAVGTLDLFDLAPSSISPLLFFGPYCVLLGYLIFQSTFLPRFLGVFMMFAGLGWLVFLSPLEKYLSLYIEIIGISAEGSLMLWLIVMGVNMQRWDKLAGSILNKNKEE
jgi:hypothetical protein